MYVSYGVLVKVIDCPVSVNAPAVGVKSIVCDCTMKLNVTLKMVVAM
jgi:hypothetical protein